MMLTNLFFAATIIPMDTAEKVMAFLRRAGFHILEAALESIFVSDVAGRIVYCNPAAEEITGYRLSELAGRDIGLLYRDPAVCTAFMNDILTGGTARFYDAVIVDKTGRDHHFSIRKAPLRDESGAMLGFLSVSRDVTESRLQEEELRAIKEFNEAVLNSARDMITVTDVDGMITYFNPAAEKITGYRKEEVLGRNIAMFYREEDLVREKLAEISGQERPAEYEAVILDSSGREHLFSIHKAPLFDDDGRLIGFAATSRDITEKREREEELRRLKAFNEAVLKSVHDLVVVTDLNGYITYYNPMAEDVTGYTFEEVRGRHISEYYQDPDLSDGKLNFIRQTGEANSYTAAIVTRDGQERILEVNKAPLHDEHGRLAGFAAISRDVTRKKMAEERICELQDLLSGSGPIRMESELLGIRARDMLRSDTPPLHPDDTFAEAAERLIRHDLPSLPVTGDAGEVLGVVTLKDLAEKGLFQGVNLSAPVSQVMTPDVETVEPDAFYFDILATMVRGRTQMLPVAEGRHFRGLLTINDLMRTRGMSVVSVLDGIEAQTSVEELSIFRKEVDAILQSLVVDGALASQVTMIITEFNDRITRRVLALCEEKIGPAPVRFAWLGLGSEGRKEQTLTTDQDNAIIMEDGAASDPKVTDYFSRFSALAVDGLEICGFRRCKGDIMASNPRWMGDLGIWKKRIQGWLGSLSPRDTRDAMTFLDFRRIYGSPELTARLRDTANHLFTSNPQVLTPMAEDTLSKAPPLGLFKRFILEKSGEYKGMLNLKVQGTLILIDCLRLLAVREALFETNTLERLASLLKKEIFTREQAASITEAYQTLMGLRLMNNIRALQEGREPSNHLDPDALPQWHQQRLKDAFSIGEDLQKMVRRDFWWLK